MDSDPVTSLALVYVIASGGAAITLIIGLWLVEKYYGD